ncbi:penicillin-binding protein 2 [Nostocoides sp. HKS02]|uniref:penicillin-binding protein 2 n=1 Tax=Nostocoides sp. HKS02 TaxID=1813880 RepID=UPI001E3B5B76|nr:penicillin-binding protein 2 [Tetrasphaera sp. HKS02]
MRRTHPARVWVLGFAVLTLMGVLVGRLGQVQVGDRSAYLRAAQTVNTRTVVTPALRGRILDRNGVALVDNTSETVVTVDRRVLADSADGGRGLVRRVAVVLGVPFERLWARTFLCGTAGAAPAPACWGGSAYLPVPLLSGADPTRALSLAERPDLYPGISVLASPVREYPQQATVNAAQVLGYLARSTSQDVAASHGAIGDLDLVGRAGLEEQYDAQLRGTPGRTTVAVDPRGVVTGQVSQVPPVRGRDLVTNLDVRVQAAAEAALRRAVTSARHHGYPADGGAAVVLDTTTGGVLAAASYPAYDPDVWTGGISEQALTALTGPGAGTPLIDRATAAVYPPASTFKVVSLPAAVRAGNSLSGGYDCTASSRVGNRTFANYESRAYGRISLLKAIEVSCDTIFYDFAYRSWLAQGGLSATSDAGDPFVTTAKAFGLGAPTGVDLPGERSGRIPGRVWKRATWNDTRAQTCHRAAAGYPEVARTDPRRAAYLKGLAVENCASGFAFRAGDAVNFAIGQGDIGVTPLQMARLYAAIANGGTLWTPQLARGFAAPGGVLERVAPVPADTVAFPAGTLPFLHQALQGVVARGTAQAAFAGFPLAQWPVAGKTGTAEAFGARDTAWFVSYAPATHPRYAVAVVISQGGTGGAVAAPAARQIYDVLRTLR